MEEQQRQKRAILVYTVIVALVGLGLGLSDALFSNYFRDAYQVDAFQRGLIEVPRELPGVLTMFLLSALAFLGDKKLALLSFALNAVGLLFLALFAPDFPVMLVFLFVTSMGIHMFIPLYDSIGMSLAPNKESYGKMLGKFNSIRMIFTLLAAIVAFFGFRSGFFSFTAPIILNFIIAAVLFIAVFVLIVYLIKLTPDPKGGKAHFVFRKKYMKFYTLAALFGGRKQVIFVFGPWVLIELLYFDAAYMSLLIILGSVASVFAIPLIGRWIDKYGAPKVMILEVILFFVIYLGYGIASENMHSGRTEGLGIFILMIFVICIHTLDRVVFNFNMARSIYLRKIAVCPEDVTPTLATGMALDHLFSILGALVCGWLWWEFGPHYVFIFSGVLAVIHLLVAIHVKKEEEKKLAE